MSALQTENRPSFPSGFDVGAVHSWAEVRLAAGITAAEGYNDKARGHRGLARLIGRKIGDYRFSIDPIATTLPASDYTSLACGGLVLLFKAFGRAAEVRDKIFQALQDTPMLLEQARDYLSLYPDDESLTFQCSRLYIALLLAVEGMIPYFSKSAWDRLEALFQQDLYGRDTQERIRILSRVAQSLREQADMCEHKRLGEIQQGVVQNNTLITGLRDQQTTDHEQVVDHFGIVSSRLENIEGRGFEIAVELRRLREADARWKTVRMLQGSVEVCWVSFCPIYKVLQVTDNITTDLAHTLQAEKEMLIRMLRQTSMSASREDFLSVLGDAISVTSRHAARLASLARKPDFQVLISAIVKASKFRSWYSAPGPGPGPGKLFVVQAGSSDTTSILPQATASIYEVMREATPALVLGHFCNEYEPSLMISSTAVLFASLVSQMLYAEDIFLSDWLALMPSQEHFVPLRQRDLVYLCELFSYLVTHSRQPAIVCVIASFEMLQRQSGEDDDALAMSYLSRVISNCRRQRHLAFRLLCSTSAAKTLSVQKLAKEELLRVDAGDLKEAESLTIK